MRYVSAVFILVSSCIAGCQDSRVPALEQRVKQLEDSVRQLQTAQTKAADEDATRRSKLESCVADANAEFQRNVENNGTKAGHGSYNIPVPVVEQMQKQRQGKIDECRLLYAK